MSWWKKNNDEDTREEKEVEIKALCPYCESNIDKVLMKNVIGSPQQEPEYEWEVVAFVCPHCNKVISIENWE